MANMFATPMSQSYSEGSSQHDMTEGLDKLLDEGVSIYFASDSSPQCGYNWLLSAYSYVSNRHVKEVIGALHRLRTLPAHATEERLLHVQSLAHKLSLPWTICAMKLVQ
eukprot:6462382-Amphidinium_carterae.4